MRTHKLLGTVLAASLAGAHAHAAGATLAAQVEGYRSAHETRIVDQLAQLVRFESVAADPAGIAAAARYLRTALRERGFDARLLSLQPGVPPIVFGQMRTPGASRTVVFYAHYDGQPVAPAQWHSAPFDAVMRRGPRISDARVDHWRSTPALDPEWRLFGRAAADDKASIVALLAAVDALKAAGRLPSVNVKVVWEGEEEAGSPHLEAYLRRYRGLLAADLWLIGDGPVHQSGRPTLYFGARGIMGLEMTIYGPLHPLHDGHYGNWAPNPAAMAATLLAEMRDEQGGVRIPGFGDRVRAPTPMDLRAIAALPPVDAALERQFGIARPEGSLDLAMSLMRPALNVRGIRAGEVGARAVTAIPADAELSLDFRLVPDQTPRSVRAAVERFLHHGGWTIVDRDPDRQTRLAHSRIVRLEWDMGYPAMRTGLSTPAARAVIAAAEQAARAPVAVVPMMGGSVPIYLFAKVLERPVIILPIVNFDDRQHAADENLRLQNLWDGIETYAAMIGTLRW